MKDYKKILEGVVSIINTTEKSDIGFANICSYIGKKCPELKESEDERIRKDIIHLVQKSHEQGGYALHKYEADEMLDWLEKQSSNAYELGYTEGMRVKNKEWIDKQGEQKPYGQRQECVDCQFNYAGECKGSCAIKRGEQKPADKSKIKPKFKTGDRVIGIVSGMSYFITEVCDDHYNTESGCIIMFCSQDNFELYEQKTAKWSKEDDAIRNDLINYFRGSALETSEKEVINWLKSLRPQSQWKPSDRQIQALVAMLTVSPQSPAMTSALIELYQNLKKLREE